MRWGCPSQHGCVTVLGSDVSADCAGIGVEVRGGADGTGVGIEVGGGAAGSDVSADGTGVGVEVGGGAAAQRGGVEGGHGEGCSWVLIVGGHKGQPLTAIAQVVHGAHVVGRASGTELVRGLRWRRLVGQREGGDRRAVHPGGTACVAGKLWLRVPNRACVCLRLILLTAVILESTVAEHCYDTQEYHRCENSSSYDNSSSCHPTRSPSNPAHPHR